MSRPSAEPNGIDWDQLVTEYRAGATFAELGAKWGRDPSTIRKALIRAGVRLEDGQARTARGLAIATARRRAAIAERHDRVRQLHEQGAPIEDIAVATGYAPGRVRQLVGANKWRDEYGDRNARVVEVYRAGHTVAETARITGVQPTQVGRIVQRAGVSRRRGPVPKAAASVRPFDRSAAVYVAAPAAGGVCCRCDHAIAGGSPAVSMPGLDGRGLAHPDCI